MRQVLDDQCVEADVPSRPAGSLYWQTVTARDMDMPAMLEKLRRKRDLINAACRNYGASRIRVFGSVAQGEEGPDSDADFLVYTAGMRKRPGEAPSVARQEVAVRLTEQQRARIVDIVRDVLGDAPRVTLFGSRVDEKALGGDVDLLVETTERVALTTELSLQVKLEQALDLPVDLITALAGKEASPIVEIARLTGVVL